MTGVQTCALPIFFQRRSRSKDTWPGALDVAVGGHLRSGETLAEALREAEEEIGLALAPGTATTLGRRFAHGGARGSDNEVQQALADLVERSRPVRTLPFPGGASPVTH